MFTSTEYVPYYSCQIPLAQNLHQTIVHQRYSQHPMYQYTPAYHGSVDDWMLCYHERMRIEAEFCELVSEDCRLLFGVNHQKP
jgi:hypothetical protein